MCMDVRPWRLGRAKFTRPSPPYVVPSSEKIAWFWLIGNSCPLHIAQPFGAKLNEKILISVKKGVDMDSFLVGRARRAYERGGKIPCIAMQ